MRGVIKWFDGIKRIVVLHVYESFLSIRILPHFSRLASGPGTSPLPNLILSYLNSHIFPLFLHPGSPPKQAPLLILLPPRFLHSKPSLLILSLPGAIFASGPS